MKHKEYANSGSRSKSYITLCQRLRKIPESKRNIEKQQSGRKGPQDGTGK